MTEALRRTFGPAVHVAIGLAVQAVTTYVTLILSGRILGAAEFGGLAALYVLLTSVATGLFQPLEQELARRRGREWETGRAEKSLFRRALAFAACLCLLVGAVALLFSSKLIQLLNGEPQLLAAFCVALPGYALCFVTRGEMSGARRLARYGLQLSVEGVFRLVGLGCLMLLGLQSAALHGWLFALAPWVAVGVSAIGMRVAHGPDDGQRPLAGPLTLLLASALAAQLLIGAGPVVARLFGDGQDAARIGAFLAALVVVRVPVILFAAVQPRVLPAMAANVEADRKRDFNLLLARVFAAMMAFAIATTLAVTAVGPWGLTVLFGPDYALPRGIFLLMGVSVGLFMAAGVLGQAVLALGRHRFVALGWLAGLAGLATGTAIPGDAVMKASLGLLIGSATVAALISVLVWVSLRQWQPNPPVEVPPAAPIVQRRLTRIFAQKDRR